MLSQSQGLSFQNLDTKARLLGSLILFTQVFFRIRTGREFTISRPESGEPHVISICRNLSAVFRLNIKNQLINIPPGWGKSELCKHFVAWALAHYPDSNFLYISKDHDLATHHTAGIKAIMQLPLYKKLFGVNILHDTNARDFFKTDKGGIVAAFGSGGGITGYDAGLPHLDRFSGCIVIDDIHKPDDIHSDTKREHVIRNYFETIMPRRRGINVPIIFIGQRLHEDDLCQHIVNGEDGLKWDKMSIQALTDDGLSRYPEVNTADSLRILQSKSPYVFASQYQQNPIPAGGGLFKPHNFQIAYDEPTILKTFITADTAETQEKYNDATVFSFWGLYKINDFGVESEVYGLHWIDCIEIRVEPKDLQAEFIQFYQQCMMFHVKPEFVCIEKKSTGVTLISVLNSMRGIKVLEMKRSVASGSKSDRFLSIQPYVSQKLISLPASGNHTDMCIAHCSKITANNTHRHDDIADTLYDAVKIALIDKFIVSSLKKTSKPPINFGVNVKHLSSLRSKSHDSWR